MSAINETSTSVKVPTDLFETFKSTTVNTRTNFKRLSGAALKLYSSDGELADKFRDYVHNYTTLSNK